MPNNDEIINKLTIHKVIYFNDRALAVSFCFHVEIYKSTLEICKRKYDKNHGAPPTESILQ